MTNGRSNASVLWNAVVLVLLDVLFGVVSLSKDTASSSSVKLTEKTLTLTESAFDLSLYHQLQEPYKSFPCLPKRIHVSQASDAAADGRINMTVSFSLDLSGCQNAIPTVLYGSGFHITRNSTGFQSLQFNFSALNESYASDWIFHATLSNLSAGDREYWYRIVVNSNNEELVIADSIRILRKQNSPMHSDPTLVGESPTISFRTPPLPGAPTTIALIGDVGQTHNSTKTMSRILRATTHHDGSRRHPVSLVLIAGDISYANSEPRRWESWLELMEPLLRTVPVHVAAGNHEIECDEVTRNIFVPYENWFHNPNRIGPADTKPVDDDYRKTLRHESCSASPSEFIGRYDFGNAFYACQHGLTKIIVLNSYSDSSVGSMQYKWLEKELHAVNRSLTPWLVVSFHCPLYTTFEGHVDEIQAMQTKEAMEPLFIKYKVNLVVSGHDHGYMRTFPMAYGKPDPSGKSPIYLTVGTGGQRGHVRNYRHHTRESWVAKRDRWEFGYSKLRIVNTTHAQLEWVRDGTTTTTHIIRDRVWTNITRHHRLEQRFVSTRKSNN